MAQVVDLLVDADGVLGEEAELVVDEEAEALDVLVGRGARVVDDLTVGDAELEEAAAVLGEEADDGGGDVLAIDGDVGEEMEEEMVAVRAWRGEMGEERG